MQVRALIIDTLRETIDKKLFWVNLLLSIFLVAGMACVGFDEQGLELLFGWYRYEEPNLSTSNPQFRSIISLLLNDIFVDWYVGWIGCILGLIATAGIFPTLMQRGTIDSLLARPFSRWKLFFAKYLGSLSFIAIQTVVFVVLVFVVVGWRWRVWFPGLLLAVPLIVLLFSYLYCICVAFGIWTRSAMASFLLTMAVWFLGIFGAQAGFEYAHSAYQLRDWERIRTATSILRWVMPKTGDVPRMLEGALGEVDTLEVFSRRLQNDAFFSRVEREYLIEHEKRMRAIPWYYNVGSSLLFEGVVLLVAGWRFSRKDF